MIFNSSKYNESWQDKQLAELGTFQRGKSRHRPRNDPKLFKNGKYPLVQTGEVKAANLYIRTHNARYSDFGLLQSAIWPENTLCITIAANIAETALLGYPMCFPDSIVGFNADPNESSELFMHYVFTYIRKSIQDSASGSIQDNINIDYLTGMKFKIPEKSYQDKIVAILSGLDKKIELNNQINAELEAMAKTLYDYWFVQFDFPDADGKPYKSSGGKMVYNKVLKREIPEGYEVKKLSETLSIGSGYSFNSKEYTTSGTYKIITIKNVQDYGLTTDNTDFVDKVPDNLPEYCKLKKGDILISLTGNVGRLCMVDEDNLLLNQRVGKFLCNKELKNYFYLLFLRAESRLRLESIATGSSQKNLSSIDATDFYDISYPKKVIEEFNEKVNSIFNLLIANSVESKELSSLRDWLLPMLMNGQVTVK